MIAIILSIGGGEILLIFLFVLLFFGPKAIPDAARTLAKIMKEIQKATDEIKREINESPIASVKNDIEDATTPIRKDLNEITTSIKNNLNEVTTSVEKEVRIDLPEQKQDKENQVEMKEKTDAGVQNN